MENCIKFKGKILFDPEEMTSKQGRQSEWKKFAMVVLEPDLNLGEKGITDYYAWFFRKRFNIPLHRPLRGAHVTIINDRASDTNGKWEEVKSKWDGKEIDIYLHVDPFLGIKNRMGNYVDWWLTVPYEYRDELGAIRMELGLLAKPYFGFHMTIGTAINFYPKTGKEINATKAKGMFEEHSRYIIEMAQGDLLNLGEMPENQQKAN
jgi:hypothetical protein